MQAEKDVALANKILAYCKKIEEAETQIKRLQGGKAGTIARLETEKVRLVNEFDGRISEQEEDIVELKQILKRLHAGDINADVPQHLAALEDFKNQKPVSVKPVVLVADDKAGGAVLTTSEARSMHAGLTPELARAMGKDIPK